MIIVAPLFLLQSALAETLTFDQGSGTVEFLSRSDLHMFTGKALSFRGFVDTDTGRGRVAVDAGSLTTFLAIRDKVLHDVCLETQRFPEVAFTISSLTGFSSELETGSVEMQGKLTIRDVTRNVSVDADYTLTPNEARVVGALTLRWTDFGVPDPSLLISKLEPEVRVRFEVTAERRAIPETSSADPIPSLLPR